MKYSIIIPVYNVKMYLYDCLRSVWEQSFEDYEIILIDDGSQDGTEKICDQYAESDERIQVIHQKNCGVSAARNRGIAAAKGEFLIFLDSDDLWCNHSFLEKIDQYTDENDVIVFDYKVVPEGEDSNEIRPQGSVRKLRKKYIDGKDFLEDALDKHPGYLWYPYKYILRRNVWVQNRITFPEGRIYEDCATIYQFLLNARGIVVIDECFYHYRVARAGSLTSGDSRKMLQDRLFATVMPIQHILQENGLSDKLKKVLCGNFAAGYYEVLIRSGNLSKEEQKIIFKLLEENEQVRTYAIVFKQKVVNLMIFVFGIPGTARILGIRRRIKYKT